MISRSPESPQLFDLVRNARKICRPYLLLLLALLAGCTPHRTDRVDGCGFFTPTNSSGFVYWGHLEDSTTNNLQFILFLPGSDQVSCGGSGGPTGRDSTYDYCTLTTKRDGHQWKIEANGSLRVGTASLRLSDLTANTVTNIDLNRSRMWRISDDRILTPLDEIDSAITQGVLQESDAGFKRIQTLRPPPRTFWDWLVRWFR